jgi:hypothetical protein
MQPPREYEFPVNNGFRGGCYLILVIGRYSTDAHPQLNRPQGVQRRGSGTTGPVRRSRSW